MSRKPRNNGMPNPGTSQAKYDTNHTVLAKTYGALADLRRELADSRSAIAERTDLLKLFSECADPQRAWLLLEDYFSKIALARKDFPACDWWSRMLAARGQARLEELALLFLRSQRPLPTELIPATNLERLALLEETEQEQQLARELEQWMFPPSPFHLDAPRAALRVMCSVAPNEHQPAFSDLEVAISLFRPRTGEKLKTLAEIKELTLRATHEQELFPPSDWAFVQWLAQTYPQKDHDAEKLRLQGLELLDWLAHWGNTNRLEFTNGSHAVQFHGQVAELKPDLEPCHGGFLFTHRVLLPDQASHSFSEVHFMAGQPGLVLAGKTFYVLRNVPAPAVLHQWLQRKHLPISKLSHRFLARLRKANGTAGSDWDSICVAHPARPRFIFELAEDVVRLRLLAQSARDSGLWQWTGLEWQRDDRAVQPADKPEFLDDHRLEPATKWLRSLDWFTPEPGLWIADAQENFLNSLAAAWPSRPSEADYLGNTTFQRLFLAPRKLRPRLLLMGSGIDWFSVSAAWESEGLKLSRADLERLATATSRFVKLPDTGWVELDTDAVIAAHESLADLGLEQLTPIEQKVDLVHATHMDEKSLARFDNLGEVALLRRQIDQFQGVAPTDLPAALSADLRPYQKQGFDFLCHLSRLKLGGILADEMGLGKTLQTLAWVEWLKTQARDGAAPSLVICPASVLHNWRREANRFTAGLKVLVLESGAARHNLRQQIPGHDLIVTNYALLRRDLEAFQKFSFRALILDEAQFIKNPSAQVTQSVKQLRAAHRLALTGTPMENRLLDLWSIIDFAQPGYLGSQADFVDKFDSPGKEPASQQIARRRLSARLRPLLLRRLKRQVAQDLPERIEERRDCDLGEAQRKLYLAELRRSREQVFQTVADKGLARSKIHVLAALTRLRQICCHPQLVGDDALSGKTETFFELLEPLLADGEKILVFSQFVQMLNLLRAECLQRQISTHMLTGATKDRQAVVQAFQNDPAASVFLLSLRAAGTGLNLTSASYVVLYDPWWNPAVEAQAIDRSHRIGQTRTVVAFKLISPGTVEEKIWELQQHKAKTISDVLGEEGFARNLNKNDLEFLFAEP